MAHDRRGRYYRAPTEYPEESSAAAGAELAAAAVHVAGAKAAFNPEGARALRARVNVTAVGATPTMTVRLEGRCGTDAWVSLLEWPAKTTVSTDERAVFVEGWDELRWNVVANTNVTFAVDRVRLLK